MWGNDLFRFKVPGAHYWYYRIRQHCFRGYQTEARDIVCFKCMHYSGACACFTQPEFPMTYPASECATIIQPLAFGALSYDETIILRTAMSPKILPRTMYCICLCFRFYGPASSGCVICVPSKERVPFFIFKPHGWSHLIGRRFHPNAPSLE